MPVFVIGHKNPDTDAICSAIGYADFLRRTERPDAVAACCGEVNARTVFALAEARLEHPRLLMDVRLTAGDVCERNVIAGTEDETLLSAFNRVREHNLRSLPVLGADGRLVGLVSLSKLVDHLLPKGRDLEEARVVDTSIARVCRTINGTFQHAVDIDREQPLILTVGALSAEAFEARIGFYPAEKLLILAGDRPTIQRPAIEYGTRCLIISGGHELEPELLDRAIAKGVTVITSPHDTATTTILVKCAKRITDALETSFESFPERTLLRQLRTTVHASSQPLFPVTDDSGMMVGVVSKSDLLSPEPVKLILVDHNEFGQAVHGADEAEILEVIDHHRLGGGLTSREPIRFINDPVGSTCTIVSRMYKQAHLTPSPEIALCLASGIISDTLHLTSPTTTNVDREILPWLEKIAGQSLSKFAERFFSAGSALQINTPEEAVGADCKEYEENGWRIAVAQVEELGFDHFWPLKDRLREALESIISEKRLDFACLLITDITNHDSFLLVAGSETVVHAIDYPRHESHLFRLDGVVSRKKQLLPRLMYILGKLSRVQG